MGMQSFFFLCQYTPEFSLPGFLTMAGWVRLPGQDHVRTENQILIKKIGNTT